ncbi:hypothetical protein FMM05_15855 [Flavobacterium zepuense]|uniref:Uncharacterized protein n=1 Tax=Flavobacterium zepuense TaxID=2593302 RepID=A0A552UWX5_9FLAO|nr:hypothetical protein [Flavobacterium zepuense]TRW22731.1 hypothetical protein FMM05_15855 [Flavobacterium zepuense]
MILVKNLCVFVVKFNHKRYAIQGLNEEAQGCVDTKEDRLFYNLKKTKLFVKALCLCGKI